MPRRRGAVLHHLLVRHHCSKCGARVIPFDMFEHETLAPEAGKKGGSILLKSYNASHAQERWAYCWSCKGFQRARRLVEDEIREMYLSRRGVYLRGQGARRSA